MSVSDLKHTLPEGFDNPTALPQTPAQNTEWQEANRAWWESHPMRYDFSEDIEATEFTKDFYDKVDERFFSDVKTFMTWDKTPFDPLIDFASLGKKNVLEIGVGNGSHAQLISGSARSYTGIDLTDYAVKSTTRRLELAGQLGAGVKIVRMDAEKMDFPENSFDFVWSWGVIHHSANTRRILEEIHRVLRPGGEATIMVYYRNFWNYHIVSGLFRGVFQGKLWKTRSLHKTRQGLIDGAIARYYTIPEWRTLVSDLFSLEDVRVYGSKSELLPLPSGRVKSILKSLIPDSVSRFLTNQCRMGMFLVSTLKKPNTTL
ncbi:MAG TPA: class I SAM-dependent methyltransferase [Pyrinomonadaceae bacterium]|nr:class I SAM-dependent methyltransferase [Pyrinomonadaceae bacterium]